jgi:tRNA-specific 2-thiouridylase
MKNIRKIFVAMSGGVDSSVAAYLLYRDGKVITGATMCLGIVDEAGHAACCGPQAVRDARAVCDQLDMPHYVLDFSKQLHSDVIRNFVECYSQGRTPNPCVRCNRYLKFSSLLHYAQSCGYDAIATGHYARTGIYNGARVLMRHHDQQKDQSYFLYSIPAAVINHVVFPLENMTKDEVRKVARSAGLPVAEKKESQEICFIPDDDYRRFLRANGIVEAPGPIIDTSGKKLGSHRGIFNYTIGQRKGLGVATGTPRYVIALRRQDNTVVLGGKEDLLRKTLTAREVNLFVEELPAECTVKVRYTQKDVAAQARMENGELEVSFEEPVEAVTPGQSVVLYYGDVVLGGGIINDFDA